MAGTSYVIGEKTRKRCTILPTDQLDMGEFKPLSMELFDYFFMTDRLEFNIYFRVGREMIEFIKANELSHELLHSLKSAMDKQYDDINIYIRYDDIPKFERLLKLVRQRKIEALLEKEPHLDRRTLEAFGDLSNASQMIVRGGVTKATAGKIQNTTSRMVDFLLDNSHAVGSLSRMVACDPTLYDHAASVAMISSVIASRLIKNNFSRQQIELIAQCGLYHDMGKTCVPNHVLNKPGKFTPEEFEVMKTHTTLGHKELMQVIKEGAPIDNLVARVALEHHERFTGKGYPHGRKGRSEENSDNGIHIATRIVTIADVYSALLMKRVYKPAYDASEAIRIMANNFQDEYDPDIFIPFLKHVVESLNYYTHKQKGKGRILIFEDGKLKVG